MMRWYGGMVMTVEFGLRHHSTGLNPSSICKASHWLHTDGLILMLYKVINVIDDDFPYNVMGDCFPHNVMGDCFPHNVMGNSLIMWWVTASLIMWWVTASLIMWWVTASVITWWMTNSLIMWWVTASVITWWMPVSLITWWLTASPGQLDHRQRRHCDPGEHQHPVPIRSPAEAAPGLLQPPQPAADLPAAAAGHPPCPGAAT